MKFRVLPRMLIVALCLAAGARAAAAGQAPGAIEGTVADSGGGMLPGVLVEITRPGTRVDQHSR